MIGAEQLARFDTLLKRVRDAVDVLIQISENYYVMSDLLATPGLAGGNSLRVVRTAVGLETVSRIYRLMDPQPDAESFHRLRDLLCNQDSLESLFARFNWDNRKTRDEFDALADTIKQFITDIDNSLDLCRVRVFRQRYVGHLIPSPRDLQKFGPQADAHSFSSAEIRKITDGLSHIVDKLYYLADRSGFPFQQIADGAKVDARDFWVSRGANTA